MIANCGFRLLWSRTGLCLQLLSILLTALLPFGATARNSCGQLFQTRTVIPYDETVVHWTTPLDLGYHDKYIMRDPATGRRFVKVIENEDGFFHKFDHLELMPGAKDESRYYYAKVSFNRVTQRPSAQLYAIGDIEKITDLSSRAIDELTWKTYREAGLVAEEDIASFRKTEAELSAQRKISFVTTTTDGRPLAVMRLYDGSPDPVSFFSDKPCFHTSEPLPQTDPRLPIERRYPHLKFRGDSEYVFEAGRLAKADELEDALRYQFYNLGSYLMTKFGFAGLAPRGYVKEGRVYVEITARHLDMYLRSPRRGGLGFKLFAMAKNGQPMTAVKSHKYFSQLGVDPSDRDSRFILYLDIHSFISRFRTALQPVAD